MQQLCFLLLSNEIDVTLNKQQEYIEFKRVCPHIDGQGYAWWCSMLFMTLSPHLKHCIRKWNWNTKKDIVQKNTWQLTITPAASSIILHASCLNRLYRFPSNATHSTSPIPIASHGASRSLLWLFLSQDVRVPRRSRPSSTIVSICRPARLYVVYYMNSKDSQNIFVWVSKQNAQGRQTAVNRIRKLSIRMWMYICGLYRFSVVFCFAIRLAQTPFGAFITL